MIVFSLNTTQRSSTTIRHTHTHTRRNTDKRRDSQTHPHTHRQAFAGHYRLTAVFYADLLNPGLMALPVNLFFYMHLFFLSFSLDLSLCLWLSLSPPPPLDFCPVFFYLSICLGQSFSVSPPPSLLCSCHSLLINLPPPHPLPSNSL